MIITALINLAYASVSITLGVVAMLLTFRLLDKLTFFDTARELKNNNVAVAIFSGMAILGSAILSAIIIGMSVN